MSAKPNPSASARHLNSRRAAPRVRLLSLLAPVLLAVFCLSPPATAAGDRTQQPVEMSFPDAVRVLGKEQSAAEQYAVILNTLGKQDMGRYVQGITRYADAKAEFDGLIEELKTDLIQGRDPTASQAFVEALRIAAEKRIAFTSFVADEVVGNTEGARASLPDVLAVVPDLIRALTDAGLGIWREYRNAGKARRDEIVDQLNHLKWRSFADIAKP